MFVAYCLSRYQDCEEEHAKIFASVDDAVRWLDQQENPSSFPKCCVTTCRLFHLGTEIPLTTVETEVPQPIIKGKKLIVAERDHKKKESS